MNYRITLTCWANVLLPCLWLVSPPVENTWDSCWGASHEASCPTKMWGNLLATWLLVLPREVASNCGPSSHSACLGTVSALVAFQYYDSRLFSADVSFAPPALGWDSVASRLLCFSSRPSLTVLEPFDGYRSFVLFCRKADSYMKSM